jgi:hypothetical protein
VTLDFDSMTRRRRTRSKIWLALHITLVLAIMVGVLLLATTGWAGP